MPPVSDEELIRRLNVFDKCRSKRRAAQELGISRTSLRLSIKQAEERGLVPSSDDELEFPDFSPSEVSVDEIIEHQCKRFEQRYKSLEQHDWFQIKIKSKLPIGLMMFGDPHVDNAGCNWPVLKEHVRICSETDGIYGINIGDTTDNWPAASRLAALYAKSDVSKKTATRLAEWFMLDSGVKWLVWLLGNHDDWNEGAEILRQMAKRHGTYKLVCHDWGARFQLRFPTGANFLINTAHDFKGHSQWNPLHGPMKAGMMGSDCHLFVCGHKHNAASFQFENADRGIHQTFVRLRGYKYMDDYARRLGIVEQKNGSGILAILDPRKDPDEGAISLFEDVAEGAEYLTWLRRKEA